MIKQQLANVQLGLTGLPKYLPNTQEVNLNSFAGLVEHFRADAGVNTTGATPTDPSYFWRGRKVGYKLTPLYSNLVPNLQASGINSLPSLLMPASPNNGTLADGVGVGLLPSLADFAVLAVFNPDGSTGTPIGNEDTTNYFSLISSGTTASSVYVEAGGAVKLTSTHTYNMTLPHVMVVSYSYATKELTLWVDGALDKSVVLTSALSAWNTKATLFSTGGTPEHSPLGAGALVSEIMFFNTPLYLSSSSVAAATSTFTSSVLNPYLHARYGLF